MAYTDFDPSTVDPEAAYVSRPIPRIPQGSITGIRGVATPGLWSDQSYSGWDPNTGKYGSATGNPNALTALRGGAAPDVVDNSGAGVNLGGDQTALDRLQPNITGPAAAVGSPAAKIQDRWPQAASPPLGTPVKTTLETQPVQGPALNREARSGDAPGAPLAAVPEENAAMPPTATPTQGTRTDSSGSHLFPEGSLLDRLVSNIGSFRDANRLTLLAMAGGLAGTQNWGTGLSRAFTAAVPAQRADIALGNQNATAQALMNNFGVRDPALARAMATNPQMMTQLLPYMTGGQWEFKTLKGEYGQDIPVLFNARTQEVKYIGTEGIGGGAGGGVGGVSGGGGGTLPGGMPMSINHNLPANQFLAQFPQPIQAAVQAYLRGDVMPSGNARSQNIATTAKSVAQEYAAKMTNEGHPTDASDAAYMANRKMAVDLESSGNSSMGGILSNGMSAFGHLAGTSDAMVKVGSYSGPNIPGGSAIGAVGNYARSAFATPDLTAASAEEQDKGGRYGQESTKFYAATGGGEGERTQARKDATGATVSSAAKAGFLRGEVDLMQRRLEDKLSQVAGTQAGQAWMRNPVHAAELQKLNNDIAHIKSNIAQLDPNGPEAFALRGAPQTQTPPATQAMPGTPATPPARPGGVTPNGVRWSM